VRILYVEDNPANLFLVQRVARMGNHEVINYSEGQTALDNFIQDRPDLILMDVQLPGKLTGLDVVKALREAGHKTPIIAVTAYAMMGDRERCLQVGCNAYIAKPLPVGELVEMIKQYEGLAVPVSVVQSMPATPPAPEKPASEAKAETTAPEEPAAPAAKAESAAPSEPEKQSSVEVTTPAEEGKPSADVKPPAEPTKPEKSADFESVLSSSQNSPSTLSSKHQ
jgi:CheY-like chemotaxis protein